MANENLQNYTTSAGSHLKNREIWTGGQTVTWPVPEGTTELQVHVWGGGGSGTYSPRTGGGGGGYARASLAVTDSDVLSITVGGAAGTSSITVPTQSPGSPISATGGGSGGGAGGSGAITLAPTQPTYYCFTASGGQGGTECPTIINATGGAAGSPLGPGGNGTGTCNTGGGGIGGSPGQNTFCSQFLTWQCTVSPTGATFGCSSVGSGGNWLGGNIQDNYWCGPSGPSTWYPPTTCTWTQVENMTMVLGSVGCSRFLSTTCVTWNKPCAPVPAGNCFQMGGKTALYDGPKRNTTYNDWFYVEDMGGASGGWWSIQNIGTGRCTFGEAGAGAGGGRYPNQKAGILGGGGMPGGPSTPCAGCAGGSGGSPTPSSPLITGSPGVVMIYW